MDIDNLTYSELKAMFSPPSQQTENPYYELVGKNVIIRTVTMIYTGRLDRVTNTDFVLVDCSWIPCTERYMQFVADGAVKECEPFPDGLPVFIGRGGLMDMCELKKSLPRSQK